MIIDYLSCNYKRERKNLVLHNLYYNKRWWNILDLIFLILLVLEILTNTYPLLSLKIVIKQKKNYIYNKIINDSYLLRVCYVINTT